MYFKLKQLFLYVSLLLLLVYLAACSIVKNYPINKPFVFDNKIELNGKVSKDEKKRLKNELSNYWDDSLQARYINEIKLSFKQPLISKVLKNPPVFDTANISRTIRFMNAYLNSQGYYYAQFKDSVPKFDTVKNQIRATIIMQINLGKNITIDSVSYHLIDTAIKPIDSSLQKMALANSNKTLLKKGTPYTKQVISNELDRLTLLFRDSGYYKITKDNFYAEIDTTNTQLLQLAFDPLTQAKLIEEANRARYENPKWNVEIKQRQTKDSSILEQYYIHHIYYYPELKITDQPDSVMLQKNLKQFNYKHLTMRYKEGKFVYKPLIEHTYLRYNQLYSETKYYKTINDLSHLPAWQQVDGKVIPYTKDSLDLYLFLTPAPKQSYSVNLEGSRNTGDITIGNLFGIATNFSYTNRNIWKRSIQSLTNLRLGTELNIGQAQNPGVTGAPLLQTFQISLSHAYNFPKLIIPRVIDSKFFRSADNKRTLLSMAGSYTDRRDYYQLRSLTTSWGYEFSKNARKSNAVTSISFKPLNVELYKIDTLPGLDTLFKNNPFLRNSFRDGNVAGSAISAIRTFNSNRDPSKSHYIRLGLEESGTLTSLLNIYTDRIFKYIKTEGEYRYLKKYRKTELATRFFIGAAFPKAGQSIPVFKQYFEGGPNSMRAWSLRELGLGSSILVDTISYTNYKERFGDMALEGNIEFRFPLFTFSAFKLSSALFTDMGNVWSLTPNPADPNSVFQLHRLGKDLAIGVGTGLRFDFSYFLLRLDFGYKLKDPARQYNNGWAELNKLTWTENRGNAVVNNYAIQFGIGLPF